MITKKKSSILETIKYLESRATETTNHYEWRQVAGLISILREAFSVTDEEHNLIINSIRQEHLVKKTIDSYITNPCSEIFLDKETISEK